MLREILFFISFTFLLSSVTSQQQHSCDSNTEDCSPSRSTMASKRYAPLDLSGQTVLITGASAGIGAATARRFGELKCKLVLVARRADRLNELAAELKKDYQSTVHVLQMDLGDQKAVETMLDVLPEEFKAVDILVNNAGYAKGVSKAQENDPSTIAAMMQVNVVALMTITKLFSAGMVTRGRGHIINIGSIAGHQSYPGGSIYCATKHAVDAFTTATRHDLYDTPVRVTVISPGMVETEFSVVRYDNDKDKADSVYKGVEPLVGEDIADNVIYAVTRPLHVQVADIVVFATAQSSAQRIHKTTP